MTTDNEAFSRAQAIAPELAPYLRHCATSDLQMPRCRDCAALQWPPRPVCGSCGGDRLEPEAIAPIGALYSWTTTHRAPSPEYVALVPYTVVVVALDAAEGVRVLGRLSRTNHVPDLSLGMRMHGRREPTEGGIPLLTWSVDD